MPESDVILSRVTDLTPSLEILRSDCLSWNEPYCRAHMREPENRRARNDGCRSLSSFPLLVYPLWTTGILSVIIIGN